jgi:hypothetical protein
MFQADATPARGFIALAGIAAVLGALLSLCMPLALGMVDRAGEPIGCGTGWFSEPGTAVHEDALNHQEHHLVSSAYLLSDYAGDCAGMIADRRWLAGGVALFGIALTAGAAGGVGGLTRRRVPTVTADTGPLGSYAAS